jgi:Flp pilus assembly protein TadB
MGSRSRSPHLDPCFTGAADRKVADMLSKEDTRRLAQLERQLQRDDPDFCARMGGGNFSVSPTSRSALPLFILAAVITVAAVVLGVVGWWIAASIVSAWAVITLSTAVYRWRRQRAETAFRQS